MSKIENIIQTVDADYQCPRCIIGRLRPTGKKFIGLYYQHKCNTPKCGYIETLDKIYPYSETRKIK